MSVAKIDASTLPTSASATKQYIVVIRNNEIIIVSGRFLDGLVISPAIAAIFENSQLDSGASGNTTTGISSAKMDVATLDSSNASLPLKIVGIQDDVENEDFAAAGIPMIVMLNNHALLQADSEAAIS